MKTKLFVIFSLAVSLLCVQSAGALSRLGILKGQGNPDITVTGVQVEIRRSGKKGDFLRGNSEKQR